MVHLLSKIYILKGFASFLHPKTTVYQRISYDFQNKYRFLKSDTISNFYKGLYSIYACNNGTLLKLFLRNTKEQRAKFQYI